MTEITETRIQEPEGRRLKTAADHVFDPLDPDTVRNPGPAYSALARQCPFYHYKGDDYQFYITSDYKEIRDKILSDNPTWSFKWGDAPMDWETFSDFGILTDPPFHLEYIAALRKGMTPARMRYYLPEVEAIAEDLVSGLEKRADKEGNFHDLFCLPLPARTMCFMLGADQALYADYKRWADELQSLLFNDKNPSAEQTLIAEIQPHFMGLIEARKQMLRDAGIDEPTHDHWGTVLPFDYISLGLVSRVEGRRFNDMELFQICTALLTGGQETTTSLLTNVVWRLLEVPERWERLKAEPHLVENVIEESLRFDPPINSHFRTSLCPVQMHGAQLPERSKLMFSMMGANRDPDIFPDPDSFVMDRPLNQVKRHLSFGYGVHFCLGAPIARLEAQVGLRKLVERLPHLRLTGSPERINSWIYWGQRELPVAWD
ncbi:cytochrome [Sphingobium sp. LB126]|uniref:cytochrome P450 n=1 Tax=Sphingobium sp. LB126 TaxID=1983755 RepID=UPI000C200D4E|nr:cytochrome P450 [Sphingobium sp. LB126]PJG46734.1 cytochrome [Sphingobium sp. LB126]